MTTTLNHSQLLPQIDTPCKPENFSLPKTPLFGTDGIRGRVGETLQPLFVKQLGFWAGQILKTQTLQPGPVILGQDSRNSSEMLTLALSAGLRSAGLEVWNLGLCPTPAVAYITRHTEAIAGVMISASHNPPEDNGFKFFAADGIKLSSSLQTQIEAGIRGNFPLFNKSESKSGQQYTRPELLHQYFQSVESSVLPQVDLSQLRIVLDLAWGATVNLAPAIFQQMGAEVICIHDRPDGDRINVNCGATHLHPLQLAVQQHNADLGFAFDGDGDRVIAVDSQGRIVDGDYILYLWGQSLLKRQQLPHNLIVATVMSNLGFEQAWKRQGGQLLRTDVGDQHVYEKMILSGAMLGGEQSGHILCPHYGITGDGILTALHLAAIVKQAATSLSELLNQSFQPYPQHLKNIRVENRERRLNWKTCDPLLKAIAHAETEMDQQGRVLVRASGTEPVIRVMVEAETLSLVDYWSENLVNAVTQYLVN